MYFAMVDYYNNLVTTDSKSMLFVDSTTNSVSTQSSYDTSLIGTFYTAINGVFTVNSLILITSPNTTQLLKFTTNDINFNYFYNRVSDKVAFKLNEV